MREIKSIKAWHRIPDFLKSSSSKEAFYAKLAATPASKLPYSCVPVNITVTKYPLHSDSKLDMIKDGELNSVAGELKSVVRGVETKSTLVNSKSPTIIVESIPDVTVLKFLVCNTIGAGRAKAMACSPKYHDMKLIP